MSETAATVSPLSPQDQVMGHLIGVVQGRAVVCAAELGIADALADGPLAIQEIASRTGVQRGNLFRLLRALESIGIFRETSPEVFENKARLGNLWVSFSPALPVRTGNGGACGRWIQRIVAVPLNRDDRGADRRFQ